MKNRKLNQLLVAGMISAAMMTSGISVQAADFSDDTSTVEEQSVGSAEEEAPEVEDGSEFQSDAAEASSAVAVSIFWTILIQTRIRNFQQQRSKQPRQSMFQDLEFPT